MTDSLDRRAFMRRASLLGASLLVPKPLSADVLALGSGEREVANRYFRGSFDSARGTLHISRRGTAFLSGRPAWAHSNIGTRSPSSGRYRTTVDVGALRDRLGSGKRLRIVAEDLERKLDLEIDVSLYDLLEAFTIEARCTNVSTQEISLESLEPIRALRGEGGMLRVPGVIQCLTNGAMYYNAGTVHRFGTPYEVRPDLANVKLSSRSISSASETVNSWWNVGLFSGYEKEGIALGYLGNPSSLGQLLVSKTGPDEVSFLAESVYSPAVVLKPGASIGSDRFMVNIAADPYAALADHAAAVGAVQIARTTSIVNGWCSWFYTLQQVSEDEVLGNAAFAAEHLRPLGLEYIQIDEGYQRWHGDWEGNERFPHGMKWLAGKIRGLGFKPGLWISPYVIAEPADVFQRHPEWLVHAPDGSLQRIGNWPDENSELARNESPKQYCLDITHPGAADWLSALFKTIAGDWGYDMIKIDFMAWSVFGARRFHDPTLSSAQVYRKGLEIMRSAVGDRCHLLECGPGAITVGLIDSMRIEADINYGYSDAAWKTYFQDPACSAAAAAKRHYLHKRTWVNDVDHVCMNLLTNQESEAAATIIALSGGNMISGDRLTQLDEYKLEILKKITPSFGEAAVPVDLFDRDLASTFALKVKRRFGTWSVVGVFNADRTRASAQAFPLERLWLDPKKTYLAFDFWRQKFLGGVAGDMKVRVAPGGVTLLALHEKLDRPQFISTDRHVLQGALELEDVVWDEGAKLLTGVSTGPLGSAHNVSVHVPGEHPWTWGGYVLFRDFGSFTLKLVENNVLQVHVRFDKSTRVEWRFRPDEFFK
jgi:hypothetical protein